MYNFRGTAATVLPVLAVIAALLIYACSNGNSDNLRGELDTPASTPKPTPTATATTLAPTPKPTPTATSVSTQTPTPTNTPVPIPTVTPVPTQTPTPTNTPMPIPTVTPVPTQTPTPTNTPVPIPTATPTPTQTPTAEEIILSTVGPPRSMLDAKWVWPGPRLINDLVVSVNIHNDIDFRDRNGLYLIGCSGVYINKQGLYFGLQTEVSRPGECGQGHGAIFSRWYTSPTAWPERQKDVRIPAAGWVEAGDYEGDFISVRGRYRWADGAYRMEIRGADVDGGGRWFEFWVVTEAGSETWVGSLRFPVDDMGEAKMEAYCATAVEVYGWPLAPSAIPYWRVSVHPPIGDGETATLWDASYPPDVGGLRNALISVEGDVVTFEVGLGYLAHD